METREPVTASDQIPLLIGTWGFDVDAWVPAFYPEELPVDWRFAYYSNWLRALLLPAATLVHVSRAQVAEWVEDTDPEFRFVIELPAAAVAAALAGDAKDLEACMALMAPLAAQTSGLLLPAKALADASDEAIVRLLGRLGDARVCVGGPPLPPDGVTRLVSLGAGQWWLADEASAPTPGGRLLVVRTGADTPARQRAVLEAASAWQQGTAQAAVFFDHPAKAQQARVLAELMNL